MTGLPADHRADLQKLEKIAGEPASLETEEKFESLFPNCAKGAMRPFGNLYGLPTCVDKRLTQEDYIVFEAGTHSERAPIYVSLDVWDELEDMTEALRKMQQEGSHTEDSDEEEES
jgi:hypothetical protein